MRETAHTRRLPKVTRPERGRGRPLSTETVRMMSVTNSDKDTLETLRFVLSFDVVERLLQLRDMNPKAKLGPKNWSWLRVEFLSFDDKSMPCAFMRLAPGDLHQSQLSRFPKLTKDYTGHQFKTHVRASTIGVRNAVLTQRLETMWMEDRRFPRGLLLIFEDDDMLYTGTKRRLAEFDIKASPATSKGTTP